MSSLMEEHSTLVIASIVAAVGIIGLKLLTSGGSGGLQRIQAQRKALQSVEVSKSEKGEGGIRRAAEFKDKLLLGYDTKISTLVEMFNDISSKNGSLPCLGSRKGGNGPYEFISYDQVKKRRDNLGSGLSLLGQKRGQPVGIYSINRAEWVIGDLACSLFGFPSVALYDTLGPDAVEYILNHAEIRVVITSGGKQLKNILAAKKNCPVLKTVICMDALTEQDKNEAKAAGVEILEMSQVEKSGSEQPQTPPPVNSDDIYTIMYTSGTTGNPKGVVLTHRSGVSEVAGIRNHEKDLFSASDVHMSYLPLAHSFERTVTYVCLSYGAQIGYFQGVITELFNDIAELKPTFLVGAPRVWNRLHDKIQLGLSTASPLRKNLFNWAYSSKKAAMES